MKKSILIVVVCLGLGISSAIAQIDFGLKAGLNLATAKINVTYETDFGLVAGLYLGP